MTPIEALNYLYELKNELNNKSKCKQTYHLDSANDMFSRPKYIV